MYLLLALLSLLIAPSALAQDFLSQSWENLDYLFNLLNQINQWIEQNTAITRDHMLGLVAGFVFASVIRGAMFVAIVLIMVLVTLILIKGSA